METEKFCLKWNDFEANISTAFRELREDKDFFDVTLACDDDQIQAHKVILSACSPFFRTILKKNNHTHPLLYLKGIKYQQLVSVITFMYHGEVSVAQEELNGFLLVAEDLRVKGLTQDEKNKKEKEERTRKSDERKAPLHVHSLASERSSQYQNGQDDDIEEVMPVKTEPMDNMTTHIDVNPSNHTTALVENSESTAIYGDQLGEFDEYSGMAGEEYVQGNEAVSQDSSTLDEMISGMMTNIRDDSGMILWLCQVCSLTMKKKHNMKRHVEGFHVSGFTHSCDICGSQHRTKAALESHKYSKHWNPAKKILSDKINAI